MKKICILHIGMNKTGSSSIQRFLSKYSNRLGKGIIYADMIHPNHSNPLVYALKEKLHLDPVIERKSLPKNEIDKLATKYKTILEENLNKDFRTIIFSGEGVIRLSKKDLENFKSQLLNYVDEIRIFAYVRPPISFIQSAFQQRCKRKVIELNSTNLYPQYRNRFEKFETVFGHVEYKVFLKKALYLEDVIQDFCHHFSLAYIPVKDANESLSSLAIKFLYHFHRKRKTNALAGPKVSCLIKTLSNLKSERLLLSQEQADFSLSAQSEDIKWMVSRLPLLAEHISSKNGCSQEEINWNSITEHEYEQLLKLGENQSFNDLLIGECDMSIAEFVNSSYHVIKT